MFPSFPAYGKHFFQCHVSSCFREANYANATRQETLNEILSMRALAKSLRARASEHSSNFCGRSQNFVSTFKLDGTIPYPLRNRRPFLTVKMKLRRKH